MSEKVEHRLLSKRGTLGKSELLALGVGQVIGAGVITLVGQAVGVTGRSAWLAYGIAVIIGFIMVIPYVFLSSTIIVKGGAYSVIKAMSGERLAGMYVVSYITQCLSLSLMGTSLGIYLNSLWPVLNPKLCAVFFLIFFYLINLMGISSMAKVQKIMSAILVACLMLFIVTGVTKLDSAVINFSNSEFFMNGPKGFIDAVFLYIYSVTGYWMNINYASDAKDPKHDVPWSIIMVVPIIMVVYVGVALVGGGVLPLADITNKPLTETARAIMPTALFVVFMLGGPIMALLTTINSCYAGFAAPHIQAAKDGWYPEFVAKTNKRNAPYIVLTAIMAVSIVPVLLNFSISTITRNCTMVQTVTMAMSAFVVWNLPKRFPKEWAKAPYHVSNGVFYAIMALSIFAYIAVAVASAASLTPTIVGVSAAVLIICSLYANIRYKAGKTNITVSYWTDLEDENK